MKAIRSILSAFPAWFFTILVSALILWLTLAPHPVGKLSVSLFPGSDKVVHAIMFGALTGAILLDRERFREWRVSAWGFTAVAIIIGAGAGIAIEFAQRAMGIGRSFDVADMLADFVGAFITGVLWHLIRSKIDGGKKEP